MENLVSKNLEKNSLINNIIMKNNTTAFTLVELIVVLGILGILLTFSMVSFFQYQWQARDSARLTDVSNIVKMVEITSIQKGQFPRITNPVEVTFENSTIWNQGTFGHEWYLDVRRFSRIPTDPLTGNQYLYSLTKSTGEYQVAWIYEAWYQASTPSIISQSYADSYGSYDSAFIRGTYNGKFLVHTQNKNYWDKEVYVLGTPSILSNITVKSDIVDIIENQELMYDGQKVLPWIYWDEETENSWDFQPHKTSHGDNTDSLVVIYEGTKTDLSTISGKTDLIESIQEYYEQTDIEKEESFQSILKASEWSSQRVINVVDNFINGEIGWFQNIGLKAQ